MKKKEIRLLDVEEERRKQKEIELDELAQTALHYALFDGRISATFIRKCCGISYPRAARMIDQLEELGYVSKLNGKSSRKVFITRDEFNRLFGVEQLWEKIVVAVAFYG